MAIKKLTLLLVAMFAISEASRWTPRAGQSSQECSIPQGVLSCRLAVATESPTDPTPDCCSAIQSINPHDIQCLCTYKNSRSYMLKALGVDAERCLELPVLCKFSDTPSQCPN